MSQEVTNMFRRPGVARRRGSPLLSTAIVGGAAYSAGKSAQRSATREQDQEQRLSQLEQQQGRGIPQQGYQTMPPAYQPAPQQMSQPQSSPQSPTYQQTAPVLSTAPASPETSTTEPAPDKLAQLKTLGELRVSGVLTEVEFEAEKQKILRS